MSDKSNRPRFATRAIHAARPEQCRTWPFWKELRDPERLRAARRFCPGIQPLEDGESAP